MIARVTIPLRGGEGDDGAESISLKIARSMPTDGLLLIDNLEVFLHPEEQRRLVEQLREVQKTRGGPQILATTASPYLLDNFSPEEVWTLDGSEGRVVCRRLTDYGDSGGG